MDSKEIKHLMQNGKYILFGVNDKGDIVGVSKDIR